MTTDERILGELEAYLRDRVPAGRSDDLARILTATSRAPQRHWWSSPERWLPMDLTTRATLVAPARLGRVALAVLVILAIVGLAIVAAGSRQPRVPAPFGLARNGAVMDWGAGDIYLADSTTQAPRPIVTGPTDDLASLVARDGTKFVFLRAVSANQFQLMVANIDGSGIRQVLDAPLTDPDWLEWSAGDELAIVNRAGFRRVLSIVDVAKGTIRTLDLPGLDVDNSVYWVPPDADTLVFTARPHAGQDGPVAIYTIRSDGTGLSRRTPDRTGPWYNGLDVSPDGRTVAYWNWEDDASPDGKGSHVHYLDLPSDAVRKVAFDPGADGETDLRFSPDGTHVVLQREASDAQLLITTVDGSGPGLRVGPHFSVDAEPLYGFSPDGTTVYLAFADSRPQYIDVASGAITTGPVPFKSFAGYQRLAP